MQISAKTEYACIAVLDLAMRYGRSEPLQVRKIAAAHDIPSGFLVQILLQLKSAGLVTSTRGAAGGYRLSRPPDEISVWDVMSVIEGEARSPAATSRSSAAGALGETWERAAESSRQVLQSTTFAELTERVGGATHGMYFI
jgi:Rrf2 family protein